MRTLRITSLLALLLLLFALPQTAGARVSQAAAGNYQFTLQGDRYLKYVEFDARTLADGSATGSIFFTDESVITTQDVDGTGEPEGRVAGYNLRAEVDGLIVNGNQAVVSAIIRTSSVAEMVGQRVLLTVEDNGDNPREPDKLTWGVYKPTDRRWVASDAEWRDDPGVGLTWTATDAERHDDAGVPMPGSEQIDARTFPVASYNFIDADDGAGDIRVQS
jgi:hypothetical protein